MSSPSQLFSCVDANAILKSPVNNSTAKNHWSFGKGDRFPNYKIKLLYIYSAVMPCIIYQLQNLIIRLGLDMVKKLIFKLVKIGIMLLHLLIIMILVVLFKLIKCMEKDSLQEKAEMKLLLWAIYLCNLIKFLVQDLINQSRLRIHNIGQWDLKHLLTVRTFIK